MKKKVTILLTALMIVSMVSGCGNGSKATMVMRNGHFNWTAQELVSAINDNITQTGDSRYHHIPDFVTSGEPIVIGDDIFDDLNLILTEDETGKLTEIVVDWSSYKESIECYNTRTSIIVGLIKSIAPDNGLEILNRLDISMGSSGSKEYTTSASVNGVSFAYEYSLGGLAQSLTVSASDK